MYGPHVGRLNAPVLEIMNGGEYREGQCINTARNYYDHDETDNINFTGMPFGTFHAFFLHIYIACATICIVLPLEYLNYKIDKRRISKRAEHELFHKTPLPLKHLQAVPKRVFVVSVV